MGELVEKFAEWSLRNEVHMNHQLNIIRRFADNTSKWVDTLYRRTENYEEAVEKKEKLHRLNKEIGDILDDVHEMFDTIADDLNNQLHNQNDETVQRFGDAVKVGLRQLDKNASQPDSDTDAVLSQVLTEPGQGFRNLQNQEGDDKLDCKADVFG